MQLEHPVPGAGAGIPQILLLLMVKQTTPDSDWGKLLLLSAVREKPLREGEGEEEEVPSRLGNLAREAHYYYYY